MISKGILRQGTIDSILALIDGLEDSTIHRFNPCIMSGVITYITVAKGTDTTRFSLHNTSHRAAIAIISLLNPYLPSDKKLYASADFIKDEEECWKYLGRKLIIE